MCRNIKTLFNFDPPATSSEIDEAALQYVRKISGFREPSELNKKAFFRAVKRVSSDTRELVNSLKTNSQPKDREVEERRARQRAAIRFGT